MKAIILSVLLFGLMKVNAQYVGPPGNVGREYGNPKMPLMVSHLSGANKEMLKRANKNSRHSIFGRILCFRKLCRIQSGHTAPLQVMSARQFRRKVLRNAKRGLYKRTQVDSAYRSKRVIREVPVPIDSARTTPKIQKDTLIVLGTEVLFETNKSTVRSEHFPILNSIVKYLITHPERSVTISGHSDNTGNESHNLALSKRRAHAVAQYLVSHGVNTNRVDTFGFGSSKPMVANSTSEGRRKNRRVELLIHNGR